MQEIDRPNFDRAVMLLREAFDAGYTEGKRHLADGTAARLQDVEGIEDIVIERNPVYDGNGAIYRLKFHDRGRRAALAARRHGDAKLLDPTEDFETPTLRWKVVLDPL